MFFFANKKLKKPPQKVAYLWQWQFFSLYSPDCPKQPKIGNSYWKCVSRHICSLICATYHQQVGTKNIPLMFTLAFLQGKFANYNYISLFSSKKNNMHIFSPFTSVEIDHLHCSSSSFSKNHAKFAQCILS